METFLVFTWILGAILIGLIGDSKEIGFVKAFLLSLLLSPLIGAIFVATSAKRFGETGSKMRDGDFDEKGLPQDEKYYQQVADELRKAPPREGLWLKALTLNSGNEEQARYQYVKWRVDQLVQEEKQRREVQKKQQQDALKERFTEKDWIALAIIAGFFILAIILSQMTSRS